MTSLNLGGAPTLPARRRGGRPAGRRPWSAPPVSEGAVARRTASNGAGLSASVPASSEGDSRRLPEAVSPGVTGAAGEDLCPGVAGGRLAAPPRGRLTGVTGAAGGDLPLRELRSAWTRWWSRRSCGGAWREPPVVVAVALVGLVTIDLGPAVRARAERALGAYLEREVSIGRIGIWLLGGRFSVGT